MAKYFLAAFVLALFLPLPIAAHQQFRGAVNLSAFVRSLKCRSDQDDSCEAERRDFLEAATKFHHLQFESADDAAINAAVYGLVESARNFSDMHLVIHFEHDRKRNTMHVTGNMKTGPGSTGRYREQYRLSGPTQTLTPNEALNFFLELDHDPFLSCVISDDEDRGIYECTGRNITA